MSKSPSLLLERVLGSGSEEKPFSSSMMGLSGDRSNEGMRDVGDDSGSRRSNVIVGGGTADRVDEVSEAPSPLRPPSEPEPSISSNLAARTDTIGTGQPDVRRASSLRYSFMRSSERASRPPDSKRCSRWATRFKEDCSSEATESGCVDVDVAVAACLGSVSSTLPIPLSAWREGAGQESSGLRNCVPRCMGTLVLGGILDEVGGRGTPTSAVR